MRRPRRARLVWIALTRRERAIGIDSRNSGPHPLDMVANDAGDTFRATVASLGIGPARPGVSTVLVALRRASISLLLVIRRSANGLASYLEPETA